MKRGRSIALMILMGAYAVLLLSAEADFSIIEKYQRLQTQMDKVRTAFLKSDWQKCETQIRQCLEQLPEHHGAHFLLTQILYGRGEYEKALEHILMAEKGFLHMEEVLKQFREEKLKRQIEEEIELADVASSLAAAELAARDRNSCMLTSYSTATQRAKNRLSQKQEESKSDISKEYAPIPAAYHYIHGNCLFRLKWLTESEAAYRAAIAVDPGHSNAYNNLINLLLMAGRLEEARELLGKAEAGGAAVQTRLKKAVREAAGK